MNSNYEMDESELEAKLNRSFSEPAKEMWLRIESNFQARLMKCEEEWTKREKERDDKWDAELKDIKAKLQKHKDQLQKHEDELASLQPTKYVGYEIRKSLFARMSQARRNEGRRGQPKGI